MGLRIFALVLVILLNWFSCNVWRSELLFGLDKKADVWLKWFVEDVNEDTPSIAARDGLKLVNEDNDVSASFSNAFWSRSVWLCVKRLSTSCRSWIKS